VVVLPWGSPVVPVNREEAELLGPLVEYLVRSSRIRPSTTVKMEFPWNGRRVDLATLSGTLLTSAYELKLSAIGRAIEQASYNRLAFDRSWVVTAGRPGATSLSEADALGIGVLSLVDGKIVKVLPSKRQERANPIIRARLLNSLRAGAAQGV
jgi:hypothetical protein